jgi:hypothetical protein
MTIDTSTDRLLTSGQAARMLAISVTTLHDWRRKGVVVDCLAISTGYLFREQQIAELAARGAKRGRSMT